MSKYKVVNGRKVYSEPSLPGVWRATEKGSWLVRGRKKDSRTGKLKEVKSFVEANMAKQAFKMLQAMLDKEAAEEKKDAKSFKAYANDLFARKKILGDIKSRAGEDRWRGCLDVHLIPAFGNILMAELTREDFLNWQIKKAKLVKAGKLSPVTFNGWLSILRVIIGTAEMELDLPVSPLRGIKPLDVSEHRTYTRENPNSIPVDRIGEFLKLVKEQYPGQYAAIYLGLATGLRPSSIRPLRRRGPNADILWEEGTLLVRRSHTRGQDVMNKTKVSRDGVIHLPKGVLDVLKWHQEEVILGTRQRFSDLLFPTYQGKFHGGTWLVAPFKDCGAQLKLGYTLSPRCLRRTFQNVCRAAQVNDLITRSISGHSTVEMQQHYSTVNAEEQRSAVGQVIQLFKA